MVGFSLSQHWVKVKGSLWACLIEKNSTARSYTMSALKVIQKHDLSLNLIQSKYFSLNPTSHRSVDLNSSLWFVSPVCALRSPPPPCNLLSGNKHSTSFIHSKKKCCVCIVEMRRWFRSCSLERGTSLKGITTEFKNSSWYGKIN